MREMMLKKADEIHAADETIELLQLERSLYLLDTLVPRNKGNSPPLSWEEYSKRAQSVLEAI
jgi:hypothetical protein